jgi:hypothetical protein
VNGAILAAGKAHVSRSASASSVTSNADLGTPVTISWTVTKPHGTAGDVVVTSGESRTLDPGSYGDLEAKAQSRVVLRSGSYFFEHVVMMEQTTLVVDHRAGPVVVYVSGKFSYKGAVVATDSVAPQLLVVALGEDPVSLDAPFMGVVVAPNSRVGLNGPQAGSNRAQIFANVAALDRGVVVTPISFDWPTIIGTQGGTGYDSSSTVREWPAPAVGITLSSGGGSGSKVTASASSDKAVYFTLPPWFSASRGAIANGSVVLYYRAANGSNQSCTYRGVNTTATPTIPADLRVARELRFESCSDGRGPGIQRFGSSFSGELSPSGGPYPVTIDLPLDDASCASSFELHSPSETQAMLDAFSWSRARRVDPGPTSRPAVYYASIFLRNKEELRALKKLAIHVLRRPLFTSELAAFAGRCGVIRSPGTGEGFFLPALIPGITYNKSM